MDFTAFMQIISLLLEKNQRWIQRVVKILFLAVMIIAICNVSSILYCEITNSAIMEYHNNNSIENLTDCEINLLVKNEGFIQIYVKNCSNNIKTEMIYWEFVVSYVTKGIPIIDMSRSSGSRYYLEGSTIEIIVKLSPQVFICLFDSENIDLFERFLLFGDKKDTITTTQYQICHELGVSTILYYINVDCFEIFEINVSLVRRHKDLDCDSSFNPFQIDSKYQVAGYHAGNILCIILAVTMSVLLIIIIFGTIHYVVLIIFFELVSHKIMESQSSESSSFYRT